MRVKIQLKYLLAIPPIASLCLTYLSLAWFKTILQEFWHSLFGGNSDLPQSIKSDLARVEKNSELLTLSFISVAVCWLIAPPTAITNIFTYTIATWAYTIFNAIASIKVY